MIRPQVKKHQWRITFQVQTASTFREFAIQILKMQIGINDSTAIITSTWVNLFFIKLSTLSTPLESVFVDPSFWPSFHWAFSTKHLVAMFRVPVIFRFFVSAPKSWIPESTKRWHATTIYSCKVGWECCHDWLPPFPQNLLKYQHRQVWFRFVMRAYSMYVLVESTDPPPKNDPV